MAISTTAALIGGGILAGGSMLASRSAAKKAAAGATQAADIQAAAQLESLEYLKEREEIPQQFREEALTRLGGLYGLPGGRGSQAYLVRRARQSPLYQEMIGGREAGEEAILRSAAATGGLRSGGVQEALYDYNVQLENQALLQAYNQQLAGLTGMAQLPSASAQIAQQMGDVGATRAAGVQAAAQAKQAGTQQMMSGLMGIGQLGISAYGAGMFSDRRLKKNIVKTGKVKGFNWYNWEWNEVANKMGLTGKCTGVMADEVFDIVPDAVMVKNLFLFVNYDLLLGGCDA
jgi:hypothetical protein